MVKVSTANLTSRVLAQAKGCRRSHVTIEGMLVQIVGGQVTGTGDIFIRRIVSGNGVQSCSTQREAMREELRHELQCWRLVGQASVSDAFTTDACRSGFQ